MVRRCVEYQTLNTWLVYLSHKEMSSHILVFKAIFNILTFDLDFLCLFVELIFFVINAKHAVTFKKFNGHRLLIFRKYDVKRLSRSKRYINRLLQSKSQ